MSTAHERDDVDAILGDAAVDGDLALLVAVMHDLRAEYLSAEPLQRDAALLAYTEPVPASHPATTTATLTGLGPPARRRGLQAAGLGLAGKVLLGTTLAAASVGGLQAADLIELPGLPAGSADQAVEVRPPAVDPAASAPTAGATVPDEDSADGASDEGAAEVTPTAAHSRGAAVSLEAHMNKDEAAEFVDAAIAWHDCADGVPQADRVDTCGERPHPSQFGLTDPPGQTARNEAAGNGSARSEAAHDEVATDAESPSGTAPGRDRDETPGPPPHANAPADREVGRP